MFYFHLFVPVEQLIVTIYEARKTVQYMKPLAAVETQAIYQGYALA